MSILIDILKKPRILQPKRHILLLSHMRAYTSLFGHILGSHPEIEGYYEMHIGYYSWKSLFRQKQLYYKEHSAKKNAHFMFDKILHNEHHISSALLTQKNVIPLFSLREPAETIPSIISLYQKVKPEDDFNNIEYATKYYIKRLEYLSGLSSTLPNAFYYIDSKALINNTATAMKELTNVLQLDTELIPKYKSMNRTGKGNSGDHSTELKTGTIQTNIKEKKPIPSHLLQDATNAYRTHRDLLISNSIKNILM